MLDFNYISVKSQFNVENNQLEYTIDKFEKVLEENGGRKTPENLVPDNNLVVYFVRSGGTEKILHDLYSKRKTAFSQSAVFLVAHPYNNSLAASMETLALLQQEKVRGRIFYLQNPDDSQTIHDLIKTLENEKVKEILSGKKIGLIGAPSDWLVASSPEPETVKNIWGPEIVKININLLLESIKSKNFELAESLRSSFISRSDNVIEPDDQDLDNAMNVYSALKKLVNDYKLDALSLRCFDLVTELKTTGCFGLSQLTDEGIIAGCEGDLVSTVGMLWVFYLLNETPWMGNPAQINKKNNSLVMAHCTVPRSIIKEYKIRSHFESKLGVGIQAEFEKEHVTIFRIGGKNLEKLWIAEGRIVNNGNSEDLCRTQIEIELDKEYNVDDLLKCPLGNHIVLVKGLHASKLRGWWRELILPQISSL